MDLINKALLSCVEPFFFSPWDLRMTNENDSRGAFRSAVLRWCWEASSTVIPLLHFPVSPWKPSTNSESCSAAHHSAYSTACVIALITKPFLLYLNGIVPLLIRDPSTVSAAGKVHPDSTQIQALVPGLAGAPSSPVLSATPPTCSSLHHSCFPSLGSLSLFTVLSRKWGLKTCAVLQPYPDCIMLHQSVPFCHMADFSLYPLGQRLLSSQWQLFSLPTITPRYFPILMFSKYLCWLLLFLSRCNTVTFISIK